MRTLSPNQTNTHSNTLTILGARRKQRKSNPRSNESTVAPMSIRGGLQVAPGLTPDPLPPIWRGKLSLTLVGFQTTNGTGATTVALRFGDALTFRLNSLFDPAVTTSSRQPYFFATLAAWYKRYRVDAVTIDMTYQTNYASPLAVGWRLEPPGGAGTAVLQDTLVDVAMTLPYTSVVPLSASGGQSVNRIRKRIPMHEICGLTQSQYRANVEDYAALISASPARVPLLEIAVANMISTTTSVNSYIMEMTFECEMFDRLL